MVCVRQTESRTTPTSAFQTMNTAEKTHCEAKRTRHTSGDRSSASHQTANGNQGNVEPKRKISKRSKVKRDCGITGNARRRTPVPDVVGVDDVDRHEGGHQQEKDEGHVDFEDRLPSTK